MVWGLIGGIASGIIGSIASNKAQKDAAKNAAHAQERGYQQASDAYAPFYQFEQNKLGALSDIYGFGQPQQSAEQWRVGPGGDMTQMLTNGPGNPAMSRFEASPFYQNLMEDANLANRTLDSNFASQGLQYSSANQTAQAKARTQLKSNAFNSYLSGLYTAPSMPATIGTANAAVGTGNAQAQGAINVGNANANMWGNLGNLGMWGAGQVGSAFG